MSKIEKLINEQFGVVFFKEVCLEPTLSSQIGVLPLCYKFGAIDPPYEVLFVEEDGKLLINSVAVVGRALKDPSIYLMIKAENSDKAINCRERALTKTYTRLVINIAKNYLPLSKGQITRWTDIAPETIRWGKEGLEDEPQEVMQYLESALIPYSRGK